MKKLFPIFIALSLCFTSCVSQKDTKSVDINNPHEISVNGEILSYYDTKTKINGFGTLKVSLDSLQNKDTNNIIINDDNVIRCISIIDDSVSTYKEISVGDSITKITESFEYEYNIGKNYMVIFNNGIEENPTNQNKEDNWLWINYITDEKNITQIQIFDVKYGNKMK